MCFVLSECSEGWEGLELVFPSELHPNKGGKSPTVRTLQTGIAEAKSLHHVVPDESLCMDNTFSSPAAHNFWFLVSVAVSFVGLGNQHCSLWELFHWKAP